MEFNHFGLAVRDSIENTIEEFKYLGFSEVVPLTVHPTKNMSIIFLRNEEHFIEIMSPADPSQDSPLSQPLRDSKCHVVNYHTAYKTYDTFKTMRELMKFGYSIKQNIADGFLPCVKGLKLAIMSNFENGLGLVELMSSYTSENYLE